MLPGSPVLDALLGDAASQPMARSLALFLRHQPRNVALAGSLALAVQMAARGHPQSRSFGDVDLIVPSFGCLEDKLAGDFLCAHVHPDVEVGRVLLQLVHTGDGVRIDVFRASAGCLARATTFRFGEGAVSVVALEDQAARAAALCMKLDRGGSVVGKHCRDLKLMAPLIEGGMMDPAWREHRSAADPECFEDAIMLIRRRSNEHPDRLIDPVFATDVSAVCPRCRAERSFRPAPRTQVLEILGFV